MAGMLLCMWGKQPESQRPQGFDLVPNSAAMQANRFGIEGASALEQVNQCGISKFVVEEGIARHNFAIQEGKACGVVQEALRLEARQRKEVDPRRRALRARAQGFVQVRGPRGVPLWLR